MEGRVWPSAAHTMIGLKRLGNTQSCVESVLADGVPGDLIETGVWRGGATVFMRRAREGVYLGVEVGDKGEQGGVVHGPP